MRSLILALFIVASYSASAQSDSTKIKKFRLALPDQWMGKRIILDQLLSAVPSVFPALNNVPFCLKCKTPYTLMFFYDSVLVESRVAKFLNTDREYKFGKLQYTSKYECATTYRFKGTWVMLYKDSAIAELELVSPVEKVVALNHFSMRNNAVILSTLRKRPHKVEFSVFEDPLEFVNKYPESFDPTVENILAVLLERIKLITR